MTTSRSSSVLRAAAVVLASVAVTLPAWSLGPPALADPVPTDTVASDNFNRSIAGGWGTADTGGVWSVSQSTKASVSSGQGRVALGSGQSAVETLPVSLIDVRSTVSVQVDSLPTTGNGVSTGIGVRSSSSGAYVATFRVGKAGALSLNLLRQRAGSPDVVLVSDTLLPVRAAAGTKYAAQVEVTGVTTVQVRARAWLASASAPGWQVTASDSSGDRVTTHGGLYLRSYLSGSTSPLGVSYDDLTVQKVSEVSAPIPPAPPAPVPAPTAAGSLPVGSASYPPPANATYVTAAGSRTGSGTLTSPYGSLGYAIERASTGSTIVMRAGIYRESTTVPFKKQLTIQSFPKEAIWLDGSSAVTGWQRSGNAWVVSGWNYNFDHRVSNSQGVDESSRFIDPAYPMAGYPDQVWVSGVGLRQVGSVGAVVVGTFFVDEKSRRLYVGNDPTGKQVEASTRQQAMVIVGTGTTVRGIGVRRYANTFWMGGALSAQVDNITLENIVSSENATIGLNGWGKKLFLNHISLTNNGALGLGLNKADDLRVTNSLFNSNNVQHFKMAPVSGGAKITTSKRVVIAGSIFDRNQTGGLWFDDYSLDVTVAGNTFSNNGGSGLELEALSKAVVANNQFIRNASAGLYIIDANDLAVWNNTFFANSTYSIRLFQDSRRSSNPITSLVIKDVVMRNNVLSYGTGSCPYLVHDSENKVTGQTMRVTSQGNAFYRSSASAPANLVCWANGPSGLTSFKTLSTFRSATGNDLQSTLNEGTPILTGAYQLTPAVVASTASVALPIPGAVASMIGVPANSRRLGTVSPMP